MYQEKQLVSIARRENNTKRGYLLVNPLQGKHVPTSPTETFTLFQSLAKLIQNDFTDETILFVGFAETATAIGAAVAVELDGYYLQTTREQVANVSFFDFSESHSHATEQKLSKTHLDSLLPKLDRIIFVEDEVTTGNTILNIINILKEEYSSPPKFSVLSILNGMDESSLQNYETQNISLHYLLKTDHSSYSEIATQFKGDGTYHSTDVATSSKPTQIITVKDSYVNTRTLTQGEVYEKACQSLWEAFKKEVPTLNGSILVLGTEEFMYPPLYLGSMLEKENLSVRFHATTRSPIAVSSEIDYPLHQRWHLPSLYETERNTFLYQLKQYDHVIIVSDSTEENPVGLTALCAALESLGNRSIFYVRWC